MHLITNVTQSLFRPIRTLLKPEQAQTQGTLSRQDLQRIVAAMVG